MEDNKKEARSEIIIYQTEDGSTKIDVKFQDETVWLTQAQLCELYQTSKSNISEHIKHIFEEGELEEDSVVRKFRTTGADGKNYNITHYNLDMIISLGYRVKSLIATQFRRWATSSPFQGFFSSSTIGFHQARVDLVAGRNTISSMASR